jgi:hypothetical protein
MVRSCVGLIWQQAANARFHHKRKEKWTDIAPLNIPIFKCRFDSDKTLPYLNDHQVLPPPPLTGVSCEMDRSTFLRQRFICRKPGSRPDR